MPAIAPLNELQIVYSTIQSMRRTYPKFYMEWLTILYKAERYKIPFGYLCQRVMDVEIQERYTNKIRNQSDLARIHHELFRMKTEHYEGYCHLSDFLKKNYFVGYNNICKMMLGETPEKLKGANME
jgi:hypothetical protein